MDYPPLVKYKTVDEYRIHFENCYCQEPIATYDGILVRFRKYYFQHCFYESSRRDQVKDVFSTVRAERIDWIRAALQDPNAELYVGWNKKRNRYEANRRVVVVCGNYVVVMRMNSNRTAEFVTAYLADTPATLEKIKRSPKWTP